MYDVLELIELALRICFFILGLHVELVLLILVLVKSLHIDSIGPVVLVRVPLEIVLLAGVIVDFFNEALELLDEVVLLAELLVVLFGDAGDLAVRSEGTVSEDRLLAQDGADLVEVAADVQDLEELVGLLALGTFGVEVGVDLLARLAVLLAFLLAGLFVEDVLIELDEVLVVVLGHVYEDGDATLSHKIQPI